MRQSPPTARRSTVLPRSASASAWISGRWLRVNHDRDDHRPATQPASQPRTDCPADDLLELVGVGDTVAGRIGQGLLEHRTYLVEDVLILGESPRLDLRAGGDLSGGRIAHHDDRDEALVAQ